MQKNLDWDNVTGAVLIAACGMNCTICLAHLRRKNTCQGCRIDYSPKPVTRACCKIKNCTSLSDTPSGFCFECTEYPCKRLKQLDKRYRTKYKMSMIENLNNIKSFGIDEFVKNEQGRWRCPHCGSVICVHKGYCLICQASLFHKDIQE
jgi:hypothetical protein